MVEVFIGKDEQSTKALNIPKSMLCDASSYFVKALQNFKEGEERKIYFKDDDLEAWKAFFYWLYKKEFLEERGKTFWEREKLAARSCMLGDKYRMSDFQDAAMLSLLENYEHLCYPSTELVYEIFENTMDGAPLRDVVVEGIAYNHALEIDCDLDKDYHEEIDHLPSDIDGFSELVNKAQKMEESGQGGIREGKYARFMLKPKEEHDYSWCTRKASYNCRNDFRGCT